MTGVIAAIEAARHVISALVIVVGALGLGASIVGQIRFPDFFTRVQAAALMPLAGGIILMGLAVEAWDAQIGARLALLALLLVMLGPIRTHLMAGAAHAAGLAPLVGRLAAATERAPRARRRRHAAGPETPS
jgi:multicomponent Na+:H+ antiporter subunit G